MRSLPLPHHESVDLAYWRISMELTWHSSSHRDICADSGEQAVFHRNAGHAARQAERQPGRCFRVSPLLRGCAGHPGHGYHVFRLASAARTTRRPVDYAYCPAGRWHERHGFLDRPIRPTGSQAGDSYRARRPADARIRRWRGAAAGVDRRWRYRRGESVGSESGSSGEPNPRTRARSR